MSLVVVWLFEHQQWDKHMPLSSSPRAQPQTKPTLETLVKETPSEKAIRENRPIKTIKDARGRTIVYRPMSILESARLLRTVGSPNSSNEPYMRLMQFAAAVISIDGDIGPQITSMLFGEARLDWLGDDGYVAMIIESNRENEEMMDEAVDASAKFREEVKN